MLSLHKINHDLRVYCYGMSGTTMSNAWEGIQYTVAINKFVTDLPYTCLGIILCTLPPPLAVLIGFKHFLIVVLKERQSSTSASTVTTPLLLDDPTSASTVPTPLLLDDLKYWSYRPRNAEYGAFVTPNFSHIHGLTSGQPHQKI